MAYHRSPPGGAGPYADSQGPESSTEPSSEALQAFYEDMERREILERKLSKRKSSSGTSIWSRKSLKRTTTAPPVHPTSSEMSRDSSNVDLRDRNSIQYIDKDDVQGSSASQLTSSRSVISDARERAAWGDNDAWTAVPTPAVHLHFKLHNPLGPRWYRNHHLIPPSHTKPSARPPTFFSPSFPPIGTSSSSPDHEEDVAEPSRTPSHSPLPTPTSSQTRVQDGGKPRSRKISQTDAVDLLDVTDPWGTNWHHQSPYEFGQTNNIGSVDSRDYPGRPRRASMTAMGRHKSVAPSPLSQSTSAVHLAQPLHPSQPIQPEIHIPRKLSKRKTPAADSIFPSQPREIDRKAVSAPPTPIEPLQAITPHEFTSSDSNFVPKRMSVAPSPGPYMTAQPSTSKKEKRGSMLNRLVKKFSILRKPADSGSSGPDGWNYADEPSSFISADAYGLEKGRISPEKPYAESAKRIPPPSIEQPPEMRAVEPTLQDADSASVSSVETPFSMGRLTIANPDLPGEDKQETPAIADAPLPPGKHDEAPQTTSPETYRADPIPQSPSPSSSPWTTVQSPPLPPPPTLPDNSWLRVDKPMPPPPQLATPQFSQLDLAVSTPQVVESSLPPTPPKKTFTPPLLEQNYSQTRPRIQVLSETPKPLSPDIQVLSSPIRNGSISLDHTLNDYTRTRTPPESSKRPSSQQKVASSPIKDTPGDTSYFDRSRTHSPPVQTQTPMRRESSRKSLSRQQTDSSAETTPTGKHRSHERYPTAPAQASTSHHTRERTADVLSSSHHKGKTRSDTLSVPAPVHVPFPKTQYAVPFPGQDDGHYSSYEDSPLSTSSMLANPPTPYNHRMSINVSEQTQSPPTLPPKSIYEEKRSHEPSPTTTSPTRQTETFKLVRSLSGNVYASSQTILAQGQQWEVVEDVETKSKREKSSRSKDPERRSREREREREMEMEREREKEKERQREREREREYEREREKVREREMAREKEMAREREREEREKEAAREREKAREMAREREREERERAREKEIAREKARAKEAAREREKEKVREREKEAAREREREREREKEREREREKERERERERRSRDYERKSRDYEKSREYEHRSIEYERRSKEVEYRSREHEVKPKDTERRSKDYERTREPEPSRREREKERGRESKKESKAMDVDQQHSSSYRSSKQPHQYQEETPKRSSEKVSSRHHEERPRIDDHKSSRKREEHRDREHRTEPSSSKYHQQRPQPTPMQPPPPQDPPPMRLMRNPSITARPTSELPSAEDMNAIRAKESWEMERLWRARSMYGMEQNAPTSNFIHGPGSTSSRSDELPTPSAVYGSSHTAFVVQAPFHNPGSQIYHSMPVAPPPIIYSSPASIPSIPDSISSYDPYEFRSFQAPPSTDYRVSTSIPMPRPSNPLPEPPRESPYEPASLTSARSPKKPSNDYWKHNGITTAH